MPAAVIKLVKSGVPACYPATRQGQIIAGLSRYIYAGMCERLAVVPGQSAAEKEVSIRRNCLVPTRRVEVTGLHGPIIDCHFCIQLRQSPFVNPMIPAIHKVEFAWVVAKRLAFPGIHPVDRFHAETPVHAFAAISDLANVQALLSEVESVMFIGVIETTAKVGVIEGPVAGKRTVRSGLVSELSPAADIDAASAITEQAIATFSAVFAAGVGQRISASVIAGILTDRCRSTATACVTASVPAAAHRSELIREALPGICKDLFALLTAATAANFATAWSTALTTGESGIRHRKTANKCYTRKE